MQFGTLIRSQIFIAKLHRIISYFHEIENEEKDIVLGWKQTKRLWSGRSSPRRRAQVSTRKDLSWRRSTCLASNTASKQSGSFTCELFHCQPWTDVSKRPSVPLQIRGEIMTRVDLRAAAGRVQCHVLFNLNYIEWRVDSTKVASSVFRVRLRVV
jgi:hypothetical protein